MLSNALIQFLFCFSAIVLQASSTNRIVGGPETTIAQYPYMVSIYLGGGLCGGALIRADVVLTAAHCFDGIDPSKVVVTAGSTYRHGLAFKYGMSSRVIHIETPMDYNISTKDHDIALVKLRTPLVVRPIAAISLPISDSPNKVFMTAIGWGDTQENGESSLKLRAVNLISVSGQLCHQLYGKRTTPGKFCAIYSGRDACAGDSGGPLVYGGRVYGIISTGIGCARPNSPGLYTNVFAHLNWITSALNLPEFLI